MLFRGVGFDDELFGGGSNFEFFFFENGLSRCQGFAALGEFPFTSVRQRYVLLGSGQLVGCPLKRGAGRLEFHPDFGRFGRYFGHTGTPVSFERRLFGD